MKKAINNIKTIGYPDGMTNGDVFMIMFNCKVIMVAEGMVHVENIYFPFDEAWWYAPYKESEE